MHVPHLQQVPQQPPDCILPSPHAGLARLLWSIEAQQLSPPVCCAVGGEAVQTAAGSGPSAVCDEGQAHGKAGGRSRTIAV